MSNQINPGAYNPLTQNIDFEEYPGLFDPTQVPSFPGDTHNPRLQQLVQQQIYKEAAPSEDGDAEAATFHERSPALEHDIDFKPRPTNLIFHANTLKVKPVIVPITIELTINIKTSQV